MAELLRDVQIGKHMLQLVRYGLVGVASNLAIYSIYLLVTYLGVEPKKAMTLLYIVGAFIGFFGNKRWTFSHNGNFNQSVVRYAISHLLGYLLNFFILFTFVDRLGYAHQVVQAVAIIIVAGFLFVLLKFYVFSDKS
ncbi:MAG: GtrA family protein [Sulfuricellaceae bacterium]